MRPRSVAAAAAFACLLAAACPAAADDDGPAPAPGDPGPAAPGNPGPVPEGIIMFRGSIKTNSKVTATFSSDFSNSGKSGRSRGRLNASAVRYVAPDRTILDTCERSTSDGTANASDLAAICTTTVEPGCSRWPVISNCAPPADRSINETVGLYFSRI